MAGARGKTSKGAGGCPPWGARSGAQEAARRFGAKRKAESEDRIDVMPASVFALDLDATERVSPALSAMVFSGEAGGISIIVHHRDFMGLTSTSISMRSERGRTLPWSDRGHLAVADVAALLLEHIERIAMVHRLSAHQRLELEMWLHELRGEG